MSGVSELSNMVQQIDVKNQSWVKFNYENAEIPTKIMNPDNQLVIFGKYKNKNWTFEELLTRQPKYCEWIISLDEQSTDYCLGRLQQWLKLLKSLT